MNISTSCFSRIEESSVRRRANKHRGTRGGSFHYYLPQCHQRFQRKHTSPGESQIQHHPRGQYSTNHIAQDEPHILLLPLNTHFKYNVCITPEQIAGDSIQTAGQGFRISTVLVLLKKSCSMMTETNHFRNRGEKLLVFLCVQTHQVGKLATHTAKTTFLTGVKIH